MGLILIFLQVKDILLSDWPKEGAFASDAPTCPGEVKLILGGKFVDDARGLFDYRKEMGDPDKDSIVTMHIVIRKTGSPGKSGKEGESSKCCCSIQ